MNMSTSDENHNDLDDENSPPLDYRIIEVVKRKVDFKIRGADLASELGISIDDANAELCGLLRAVGPTATFYFETIPSLDVSDAGKITTTVMIFSFPHDFEHKAYMTRRKENLVDICWNITYALIKILKVIVAFGLIISLAVVFVGGVIIIIATIVALSRNGGGNQQHSQHHRRLIGYTRTMCSSFRQLLWIFYIGREFNLIEGVDPFIADAAFTLALWNPRSLWFWLRMSRMRKRRLRVDRGWRTSYSGPINTQSWGAGTRSNTTDYLLGRRTDNNNEHRQLDDERGILSIAVEFLFGPTPFHPGPSDFDKWKMREQFIFESCSSHEKGIKMIEFLPFVDYPPFVMEQSQLWTNIQTRSECLKIVSHFNGTPFISCSQSSADLSKNQQFIFPELMFAESREAHTFSIPNKDHEQFSFFYSKEVETDASGYSLVRSMTASSETVKYLHEKRHVLTKLTKSHFQKCLLLNTANYIGLLILWKSIHADGALEIKDHSSILYKVITTLLSTLDFYAKMFFLLPVCRMLILSIFNHNINTRNERRKIFRKMFASS